MRRQSVTVTRTVAVASNVYKIFVRRSLAVNAIVTAIAVELLAFKTNARMVQMANATAIEIVEADRVAIINVQHRPRAVSVIATAIAVVRLVFRINAQQPQAVNVIATAIVPELLAFKTNVPMHLMANAIVIRIVADRLVAITSARAN